MSPAKPDLRIYANGDAVARACAEEFIRLAGRAIADHGRFTVALSGGSTPKALFEILAMDPFKDEVDWWSVELFWGDERTVPPDHKDSNYRMTHESLLTKVPIPAANVHRILAESEDRDFAARVYQEEIAHVFGVEPDGPPPAFDMVMLGMGPDGHTASLFPHTAALKETKRWVVANEVPQMNTWRITMTTTLLNSAANVYFLCVGDSKTDRLVEVLEGPKDTDRLPSQLIAPTTGRCIWMLDESAAAKLTGKANG